MKQFLDSLQFNTWAALIVFVAVVIVGGVGNDYIKSKSAIAGKVIDGLIRMSLICITAIILKMVPLENIYCWVIFVYVTAQVLSGGEHVGTHLLIVLYLVKFAFAGAVALFGLYAAYKIILGLGAMIFS